MQKMVMLESMVRWHDVSKSVLQKPILVSGIHVMQGRKRDRITGSNSGGFIWSERDKSIMHSHMHLLETSTVFVNTHKRYKDRVFILILEAIILSSLNKLNSSHFPKLLDLYENNNQIFHWEYFLLVSID